MGENPTLLDTRGHGLKVISSSTTWPGEIFLVHLNVNEKVGRTFSVFLTFTQNKFGQGEFFFVDLKVYMRHLSLMKRLVPLLVEGY